MLPFFPIIPFFQYSTIPLKDVTVWFCYSLLLRWMRAPRVTEWHAQVPLYPAPAPALTRELAEIISPTILTRLRLEPTRANARGMLFHGWGRHFR